MLTSISPVGEAARQQRWWLTVTAFTAAALAAGATLGASAGLLGRLLLPSGAAPAAILVALTGLGALGVAADRGWGGMHVRSWRRQVDERWLTTYRGWVYGAGFGAQLGVGLATIVPSAVTYVAVAALVATASPAWGAVGGAAFGALRAVPVVAAGRWRDPTALRTGMSWVEGRRTVAAGAITALQVVVPAGALLVLQA